MARRRLDAAEYTVGWICALPIELAAAQVILDEEHLPHAGVNSAQYTLGRIGSHNVVLACLPAGQMGIGAAAFSAGQATSIFTSIRFTLMVGVGGGAPSTDADVRLGDVVVSQPVREHSGVVQYDFGKTGKDGRLMRTGSLNAPSRTMLHAVSQFRAYCYQDRQDKGSLMTHYLSAFEQHGKFSREKAGSDILFEASYHHESGATCERCSENKMVRRTARSASEEVTIHYGTIASGNQVIKDGTTRDRLSKELGGVLCFEMEAAGLMNDFPCLVVRGICDYADSHKNKTWQPYAAATAAACAKAILSFVPAMEVLGTAALEIANYRVPFGLKSVPMVRTFVERPRDTQAMERALLQDDDTTSRRSLVLYGLGGIGKSQLAVEFARKHQNNFSSVLWLDGTCENKLKESFAEFASRISMGQIPETSRLYSTTHSGDIDVVITDVLKWLSIPANDNWLMVIDNVDSGDRRSEEGSETYDVQRYLPEADHGSILITTRLLHLRQLGEGWEVKKMDFEQARAMLASLAAKDVGNDADELIELLGGLPLALNQIAYQIRESGTSFSTFKRLYKESWLKQMSSSRSDVSVATIWNDAYISIRQESEAAANLLLLWAHLDNKDLWYELLSTASCRSNVAAKQTSAWLGQIARCESEFVKAVGLLRVHSLVQVADDQTGYSIHPLVHKWAYHLQNDVQRAGLCRLAMTLVGLAVPARPQGIDWKMQMRLVPHAEQASEIGAWDNLPACAVKKEDVDQEDDMTFLLAVRNLGNLYRNLGKYDKAKRLYLRILDVREKIIGDFHLYALALVKDLGDIYQDEGMQDQAEQYYERALEGYESVLRNNNSTLSDELDTRRDLAHLHQRLGALEDAERLYLQALQGYEKILDTDHPTIIDVISRLSLLYRSLGRIEEAEQCQRRVLEGRKRASGLNAASHHQDVLSSNDDTLHLYDTSDLVSVLSIDIPPSLTSASTLSDGSLIKKSAAEEFVDLLMADGTMQSLFPVALEKSGPERFRRNFLRLLTRFAVELKAEASHQVHFDAAQLVKSRANFIALRITEIIKPGETQDLRRNTVLDTDKFVLERFLQQQAQQTHKSFIPEFGFVPRSYGGDYEGNDETEIFDEPGNPKLKNLNEVKKFMVDSRAYKQLLDGFSQFVSPQAEVFYDAPQATYTGGITATLYRLHWTCTCGHKEYDDFTKATRSSMADLATRLQADGIGCQIEEDPVESGVSKLYRLYLQLRNPIVQLTKSSARLISYSSSRTPARTSSPGSAGLDGVASTSNSTRTGQQGAASADTQSNGSRPDSNVSVTAQAVAIQDQQTIENSKFMFLCSDDQRWLTTWKGLEVTPIKSDKELFNKIHDKIDRTKHWTHCFFSLKSIQRISFVKFTLRTRQEIDHLQHDQIPPPDKTHYDFHERNPTHVPPFLNNYLMHRFSNNENCHDGEICLHQFPKRVGGQPKRGCAPDNDTAWGLYFQKGWDVHKIWICGVIAILSSVLFGVLWAICRKSIQDGFSVASYVVTAEMVLVGTIQVAIGVDLA